MSDQFTYWLVVERYENWISDSKSNFCRYGIPHRLRNLASQVKAGDRLVTYVSSRYSSFSDIRCVVSDELKPIKGLDFYDDPFSFSIETTPLTVLGEGAWVGVRPHLDKLDFTKAHKSWGVVFYTALRRLSLEDGRYLENLLNHGKCNSTQ